MKEYTFIVKVAQRQDLDAPLDATEAASFIKWKLEEGAMIEVVSVDNYDEGSY
jgi:hypothetical protein